MTKDIQIKIDTLPQKAGVYIFKDKTGKVLYVGKAANLQDRVKSYFQKSTEFSPTKRAMLEKVKNIEHLVCNSEDEALLLECQLIKKYKPKYNIQFRDDKNYLYIRISHPEDFPKLNLTRKIKKDGAHYYGPFTDSGALKRTLAFIRKLFPYRDCNRNIFSDTKEEMKQKACLHYYLKRCLGPCIGAITKKEYNKIIRDCELYLKGAKNKLLSSLKREMKKAVSRKDFERAAYLRDRLLELATFSFTSLKSDPLSELKKKLKLKKLERIECYDISNISGKEATGSMVVFENGQPKKSDYRKFKIKTIKKTNDVGMMQEMLIRRLQHKEWPRPDLIVVDGGKGQLNAVVMVLEQSKNNIPTIALVKKREEIYFPHQSKPLILPRDSKALYLIQHLRDEAHRFAITYHRKLRAKKMRE